MKQTWNGSGKKTISDAQETGRSGIPASPAPPSSL